MPSENLRFLTGSADRTIKLHNENFEELRTFTGFFLYLFIANNFYFKGHTDVVRSLCAISDTLFISGSNDGTVRLWNTEKSSCLQNCHTTANEFVYS